MTISETLERLRKQSIKSVMDLIILAELRNGSMSGYDVIGFIHNRFGLLVSSGTIYSHIYALEREQLVEGTMDSKKRVYDITEKGEQILEQLNQTNTQLLLTLKNLLET
jgi:DNA-binding PadR family transcriptional regulator